MSEGENADDDTEPGEAEVDEAGAEPGDSGVEKVDTEPGEPGPDEVYCSSCGSVIKEEAEICPECGVRQKGVEQAPAQQLKNPGLAAVASFFFAGLGQIYNGQIAKGIILMVIQFVNVLLMFVLIGFITYFIVWVYGMWDAYNVAQKINEGKIQI